MFLLNAQRMCSCFGAAGGNPNSPRVHNNLGKAYFEAGKLSIARVHLEKSVSSIPGYVKAQFNIENPKTFFQRKGISNETFQDLKEYFLRHK